MSTIEPTGTRAAPRSAVGAAAPGMRTSTWPLPATTAMLWPSSGVAAAGSDGTKVCGAATVVSVAGGDESSSTGSAPVVKVTSAPVMTLLSILATTRAW